MLTGERLCQSKSHKDAVLTALNQQRHDGILCDVTLVAEKQKFHAHKAVLAACSDYFKELNSFNYLDLYKLADLFNLTLLEEAVVSFLVKHLSELLSSRQEEVLVLPYRLLREVLKSDRLTSLSEEQIWQLAVRWLEHDCRYQYMEELLQYVRYGLMDVNALHTVAQVHPLVQASETATALVKEALEYHRSPYAQPIWQTLQTKPRYQSETMTEEPNKDTSECVKLDCTGTKEPLGGTAVRCCPEEEALARFITKNTNLAVRWLEHDCRYQYMEELLQYVRYGLMDVNALHTVAQVHPLVQASETATALVKEALEYHRSPYAQPIWQTLQTKPRYQSETLYIVGGKKREVCKVKELRFFNPRDQEHVHIAGVSNWSELAPMSVGRSHHCVAIMGNFLFVAGGEVEHATGRTCAVRTACRYDLRGNKWTEIAPMKNCREHFVLGALDEYLYAVGGRNELRQVLPTVERYCPKKNKWTFVQSFDRSLSCHAGCVTDGLLWISGKKTNICGTKTIII
ncbi:UNVERIFIED_CONTAM: hypothetical protein FKN15_009082 [Acipenser sinensis]